jgi:hypothetical protein
MACTCYLSNEKIEMAIKNVSKEHAGENIPIDVLSYLTLVEVGTTPDHHSAWQEKVNNYIIQNMNIMIHIK